MIYHLALRSDLEAARPSGSYRVSSLGRTLDDEGFVHACYAGQVADLGERYYRAVRVENGFPHVCGPIELTAVDAEVALDRAPDGGLRLPAPE